MLFLPFIREEWCCKIYLSDDTFIKKEGKDMSKKRLYKDETNEVLAGVCSGIANYFQIDPTWIRLAWVLFTLAGGCGIIAYIIAALIIPKHPGYIDVD